MELFGKDLNEDLVVIAEIGVNHEGSVSRCIDLIDMAQEAGAAAAKLQYGTIVDTSLETGGLPRKGGHFAFNETQMRETAHYARNVGMPLFSSALSLDALPLCAELFDVIKIASRGAKDKELIQAAVKTGKPVIISTGMCGENDVRDADLWSLHEVLDEGDRDMFNATAERVFFMHCVSAYPTPVDQTNIEAIDWFICQGYRVGYSNHVIGPTACYAAVALGANPIEVHFTDDKTRDFRDHQLSFDPPDLDDFLRTANRIRRSLGDGVKRVMECES